MRRRLGAEAEDANLEPTFQYFDLVVQDAIEKSSTTRVGFYNVRTEPIEIARADAVVECRRAIIKFVIPQHAAIDGNFVHNINGQSAFRVLEKTAPTHYISIDEREDVARATTRTRSSVEKISFQFPHQCGGSAPSSVAVYSCKAVNIIDTNYSQTMLLLVAFWELISATGHRLDDSTP